jgi:hypothetical protein
MGKSKRYVHQEPVPYTLQLIFKVYNFYIY